MINPEPTTSRERLKRLREIAEKATPGPWAAEDCSCYIPNANGPDEYKAGPETFECKDYSNSFGIEPVGSLANAAHIAAFNPQTALALIDEVERLRKELAYHQTNADNTFLPIPPFRPEGQ